MIRISSRAVQGTLVVEFEGRLDAFHASQVRDALVGAIEDGQTKVAVDLAKVSFIDSSGLAALVAGMFHARERGGDVRLACVQEQVCVIFELTHLDTTFVLVNHVDEAIASFDAE